MAILTHVDVGYNLQEKNFKVYYSEEGNFRLNNRENDYAYLSNIIQQLLLLLFASSEPAADEKDEF